MVHPKATAPESPGPDEILRQLRSLYSAATAAVVKAKDAGNSANQTAAQREARTTLALIGKLMEKFDAAKAALGTPADGTTLSLP